MPWRRDFDEVWYLDGGGPYVLNVAFDGVAGSSIMDLEFYRQQAQRARDLAERADPFTKRRLLDLADSYDVKGGGPSRAPRAISLPLPRAAPGYGRSGET